MRFLPPAAELQLSQQVEDLIPQIIAVSKGLIPRPRLHGKWVDFTQEEFVALSSSIGPDKIHKKWTSPVTTLTPHPKQGADGLTEQEVKAYTLEVCRLFETGASVPVSDAGLISTQEDVIRRPMLNHIADQPRSRMHWPESEKQQDYGKPMVLKFCTRCHSEDGDRAPLFRAQSHPIRVLVDFGYMPPKRALKPEEIAELKAWLDQKP